MMYQILVNSSAGKLEEDVNTALAEGWRPVGGVAVSETDYFSENHKGYSNDNYSATWAQAMTRE